MDRSRIATFLLAGAAAAGPVVASPHGLLETPASLVAVSVEVDGDLAWLYPARDGSGRYYLEARRGGRYAVALANRSGERLGVVLTVDGLNAISGERDTARGRMYVLDPWQRTTVQGWRTSLHDVRQFTFVDERVSYAARSGKANEKMGWIEIAVFRERRGLVRSLPPRDLPPGPWPVDSEAEASSGKSEPAETQSRDRAEASAPATLGGARARAYPGTGWGRRAHDPVVLVSFDPENAPSESVTLRYEYRPALVALGVLPRVAPPRDRLFEREHAQGGFAPPPLW
jgi:hypothetical protein